MRKEKQLYGINSVHLAVMMGLDEKSHDSYQFGKSHKVSHDERNVMHNPNPATVDQIDASKCKERFEAQVISTSGLTSRISWQVVQFQGCIWRKIGQGAQNIALDNHGSCRQHGEINKQGCRRMALNQEIRTFAGKPFGMLVVAVGDAEPQRYNMNLPAGWARERDSASTTTMDIS